MSTVENDSIMHLGVREMQAVLWKWLQKKNEKEKRCLTDVQFSTDKKLATRQDRQRKTIFSILDPTFGCFYLISRKQRLLVETIC